MQAGRTPARTTRPQGRSFAALGAIVVLALSGCSLLGADGPTPSPASPTTKEPDSPREGTLLPEGTVQVEIETGESVQVALPEGSLGVGDYWGVVSVGDPGIVEADVAIGEDVVGQMPHGAEDKDKEGGRQAFAVSITSLEAGETTVRVLYCTRTREVSEDCDQSHGTLETPVEPVEIQVRVGA